MNLDLDPDKIIAAVLTGLAVKVGEKGIAYLKRIWASRPSQKKLHCGSIEAFSQFAFKKKSSAERGSIEAFSY